MSLRIADDLTTVRLLSRLVVTLASWQRRSRLGSSYPSYPVTRMRRGSAGSTDTTADQRPDALGVRAAAPRQKSAKRRARAANPQLQRLARLRVYAKVVVLPMYWSEQPAPVGTSDGFGVATETVQLY